MSLSPMCPLRRGIISGVVTSHRSALRNTDPRSQYKSPGLSRPGVSCMPFTDRPEALGCLSTRILSSLSQSKLYEGRF